MRSLNDLIFRLSLKMLTNAVLNWRPLGNGLVNIASGRVSGSSCSKNGISSLSHSSVVFGLRSAVVVVGFGVMGNLAGGVLSGTSGSAGLGGVLFGFLFGFRRRDLDFDEILDVEDSGLFESSRAGRSSVGGELDMVEIGYLARFSCYTSNTCLGYPKECDRTLS